MRGWRPWPAVVIACASATACSTVLGFDQSPELSPYNYLGDTSAESWQQSKFSPGVGFHGGAFDGRYVYLAPEQAAPKGGVVQRYDTRGAFGPASWSSFALSNVTGAGNGGAFAGAQFDGRYVYFDPEGSGTTMAPDDSVLVRYDTTAPYDSASSWEAFDVTRHLSKRLTGFRGGTFDGRYLYFAPYPSTNAVRFDTHGTFSANGSWEVFDIGAFDPTASGTDGALFDGRYIYFVPIGRIGETYGDGLVRYDTRKSFADHTAWEMRHLGPLNADAAGFSGGAFDGRYLYLAPFESFIGTVARFDTTAPGGLEAPGSWSFFSVEERLNKNGSGFCGAGFDGRFVYFVPNTDIAPDGLVVRVDSLGDFESETSWSTYDMAAKNHAASQFCGAVFDGQYMYFIPELAELATRFEARTSPQMPKLPAFFGSFF